MCGIAGGYSDKLNEELLEGAIGAIGRRGPDARGVIMSGSSGLAHCRLGIIDLGAQSNQPMTSASGKYTLIFNGEIYNYLELREKYKLQVRTSSDTEVLLELFEQRGPQIFEELNGMFAAAFYCHEDNSFTLVRDRTGKKPLYWYQQGKDFFFASELKAIQKFPVSVSLSKQAIPMFLHLGCIPAPYTIYQEVHKLLPGNYLIFRNGKAVQKEWYSIEKQIKPLVARSEEEALSELEKLLKSSIKYRLISDVPFGAFLSGGIDSSLITALAADISGEQLKTFTIGFNDSRFDESKYSRQVAQHLGTSHQEFILTEKDAIENLEDIIDYFDEPYADSSALPTYLICRMSRSKATMAISGEGGDELFMGYGAYKWANRLSNPLLRNAGWLMSPVVSTFGSERYRRAWNMFTRVSNRESLIFSQEQYLFSQKELKDMLVNNREVASLDFRAGEAERKLSPAERQELFDLKYYLPEDLLVKMDRASMMNALEVRCPFLDYRVVEFAMNLPESLKIKNGESKYLLRKLLFKYLPEDLFRRPKQGFSVPLEKWLKGDLNYLISEYLSKDAIGKTGVLNYAEVEKLKNQFMGGTGYLYNRIWALIILQRWFLKNKVNLH